MMIIKLSEEKLWYIAQETATDSVIMRKHASGKRLRDRENLTVKDELNASLT